jgi:hypothetical protein
MRTARGSGSLQICALSLQQATKLSDALFHTYRSYLVSSPFGEEKEKNIYTSSCIVLLTFQDYFHYFYVN